jgi:hypothetical protein
MNAHFIWSVARNPSVPLCAHRCCADKAVARTFMRARARTVLLITLLMAPGEQSCTAGGQHRALLQTLSAKVSGCESLMHHVGAANWRPPCARRHL